MLYILPIWPKKGIILIHSKCVAIAVLAVAIFFSFDNLGERRSVPLSQVLRGLKILQPTSVLSIPVENHYSRCFSLFRLHNISWVLWMTTTYFSQFWRLGRPRSRCWHIWCLVRAHFLFHPWLPSMGVFTGDKAGKSSEVSTIRVLIPLIKPPPLFPNHLPKSLPPNTIKWGG